VHSCEPIGYMASGLVLAAFAMKDIVRLRVVAIASNLFFLAYGLSLGLVPIWVLHAVLLPLNAWRLAQALGLNDWAALMEAMRYRRIRRPGREQLALSTPQSAA
jgi:hypothetical protein